MHRQEAQYLLDKLLPLLRLHGLLLWVHWVHPEKEQVRLHVLLCMIVSTRLHVLLCMNVRLQLLDVSLVLLDDSQMLLLHLLDDAFEG